MRKGPYIPPHGFSQPYCSEVPLIDLDEALIGFNHGDGILVAHNLSTPENLREHPANARINSPLVSQGWLLAGFQPAQSLFPRNQQILPKF